MVPPYVIQHVESLGVINILTPFELTNHHFGGFLSIKGGNMLFELHHFCFVVFSLSKR